MSAQTSKSIHQSIEAAMECLDLTLESELTLFRNRHPHNESRTSEPSEKLEEIAPSAARPLSQEAVETSAPPPTSDPIDDADLPRTDDLAAEASRLLDVSLEDFDVETDESHEWTDQNPDPLQQINASPQQADGLSHDAEADQAGAIVPTHSPSKALLPSEGDFSGSATLETYTDPALDDYLESSEVLLQHLDTPLAKRELEDSISLKWFGWAAGATVLLSILAAVLLQNIFKPPANNSEPETGGANAPETEILPSTPTPPTESQPKVDGPDLSQTEFPSVDPDNLGSLPTPETSPPSPPVAEPTPAPPATESPTAPAAESPPTTGRQYYVVTNYTDDASLEAAKRIVPEAEVVNFTAGTRIQLKQFSDETLARSAASELQQQGLSVEILATTSE